MPADPSRQRLVILDAADPADFAPLSLTRPVFGLRCGMGTLLENQVRSLRPAMVSLWVRPELAGPAEAMAQDLLKRFGVPCEVNRPLDDEEVVLVDGRSWWSAAPGPLGEESETDERFLPLRARVRRPGLTPPAFFADPAGVMEGRSIVPVQARVVRRPWDLLALNATALAADAHWFAQAAPPLETPAGVHLVHPPAIHVCPGVKLEPGVVLDASAGAICLEEGVHVGANAVIRGPCYLGRGSVIFPLTRLNGGVSLGPVCKVGGELGNVIFQGYSNKPHDGYLGDSYVGQWVNLGAGTTTSNLKNTYGTIRAATPRGREETGMQFLGAIFGDHAKCGIGTMLNAGTYIGAGSQIAGVKPPQFVRSFRFLTPAREEELEIQKLIEMAERVASRRRISWTAADAELLRSARQQAAAIES